MSESVEERRKIIKQIVSLDEKIELSKGWEIYKHNEGLDVPEK